LNLYFDYLYVGLNLEISQKNKLILDKFADWVTYHGDIQPFEKTHKQFNRKTVIDFINWGTGEILNNAIIL